MIEEFSAPDPGNHSGNNAASNGGDNIHGNGALTHTGNGSEPIQPYSASKHAVQGASENVHEAKEAVDKATNSIKDLVSGKGSMVDAALAVKGAYDNVMGITGRLSASAMMPVMQALSAFKGKAILPAGKQMDPVLGIDVHMVTIPPSPAPVPLPHPYIGVLFNAKDWVSCAINTFKQDVLGALPEPAEGDTSTMASIAKNKDAITGIAMGLAGMSASVKFGDFVPRAVTGTPVKVIPHIPMGAGFHPGFVASVSKNHGKAFLGSLFVVADGDPMVGSFHLNYDCWDIGIVDLFKSLRKGAKKAAPPGGPLAELFVPSGTIMPIPWGKPVLVNSIPTPINPLTILDKVFKAGLGKLKAAGRKAVQKNLDKLEGKIGCSALSAVSKAIGTGESHPVDVSGGHFYTDNVDFQLPGPIPLSWERTWYSYSNYSGPLGYGWHHSFDIALAVDFDQMIAVARLGDGRIVTFNLPAGDFVSYNRSEKMSLHCNNNGYYFLVDNRGLIYEFTEKEYFNSNNYTETHLLRRISNSNSFSIHLNYDGNGLLTQIIDSANRVLNIINDADGRILTIETLHLKNKLQLARYTYTRDGDLLSQSDATNNPMAFTYVNHLMTQERWPNGLTWHFRYDKASGTDAKCIEVWGNNNLLHYVFDYKDKNRTTVINSLGHKKTFYHKNGLVIKYIDPNGGQWDYRYNKHNDLEWETDPLGNQHSYSYDDLGNLVGSTNPSGGFNQIKYRTVGLQSLKYEATGAAGSKWKWDYDEVGNVCRRIDPLGAETVYKYKNGLLSEVIYGSNARTELEYDNQYNVKIVKSYDGAKTEYGYDGLGNCIHIVNPNGIKQIRNYDLKSRITNVLDFDGNVINLTYDEIDNVICYQDKQREVHYEYSGFWKLTSREEVGAKITFVYDTEEQLRKVVNEHGHCYEFVLDAVGNIVEEKGFDKISRHYDRNAAGWITQVKRPSNKYTRYEYDNCGMVTDIEYSDHKKETFAYRLDGELIFAKNEFATVKFERDATGNILKEIINGEWIASDYDQMGNRTRTCSSLGANILQRYNDIGDTVKIEANGWFAEYEHDRIGLEVKRKLPGGIVNEWHRDGIGRPLIQTTTASKANFTKRYKWDVKHRLLQISHANGKTNFEHDIWSNLSKTVFPDGSEQFRVPDAIGNVFNSSNRRDRLYGDGGQLKQSSKWTFNYDLEGNLIEKKNINGTRWLYYWDDAGRLKKVTPPDGYDVCFTYDALGRRLSKSYKKTTTKFIWDGNITLHEWKEFNSTEKLNNGTDAHQLVTTWIFDNNTFTPAAKIKGEKKYSILCNHLGTPTQMFTDNGDLSWDGEMDSYGKLRMVKGENGGCPFRFQGQYEDIETGLSYNRFRYYSPDEGIYISQDPIRLNSGEQNLYAYVCDTNIYLDVFGLRPTAYGAYKTKDEAARAVLKNANRRSIAKNMEFGGLIYEQNGKFYPTRPIEGTATSFRPSLAKPMVPKGAKIVGDYHTHGAETPGYDSNKFSRADRNAHSASPPGHTSYLGTPSEGFKKLEGDGTESSL